MIVNLFILAILLPICCFFPGFFFVCRLRWRPIEKLCGSIGLSLLLIYLGTFGIYLLGLDVRWSWILTALSVIAGILRFRDLQWLLSAPQIQRVLTAFGFLLGWSLLLLSLIRHFSGGGWYGDWAEHFHRVMFFLKHLPTTTVIYPFYAVPARPPMMNLLGAFFLSQTAFRFEFYQLTFAFLGLLVFFPCCLIARGLTSFNRSTLSVLVVLVALNPMFIQNITYPWTKLLAAFYVIAALSFYLRGWRRHDRLRTATAFVLLTSGTLVHYSVIPYGLFLAAHYVVTVWRDRQRQWKAALVIAVVCVAILTTWFGWSIATYGIKKTVTSNTVITPTYTTTEPLWLKSSLNLFDTLVPHFLRTDAKLGFYKQPNRQGYIRDYTFLLYQTNLFFGIGSIGGLVVLILFLRLVYRSRSLPHGSKSSFFILLTITCTLTATLIHGERDKFGVAHIGLQPVVLLGTVWLANSYHSLSPPVRWLIVAGCAVDFVFGIFLQVSIENWEFNVVNPSRGVFRLVHVLNQSGDLVNSINTDLSPIARTNLLCKYGQAPLFGLPPPQHLGFGGDHFVSFSGLLKCLVLLIAGVLIARLAMEAMSNNTAQAGRNSQPS